MTKPQYIYKKTRHDTKQTAIKKLQIKLLNIQGLTKVKAIELESIFGNNYILCLTETQPKMGKINVRKNVKNVKYVASM